MGELMVARSRELARLDIFVNRARYTLHLLDLVLWLRGAKACAVRSAGRQQPARLHLGEGLGEHGLGVHDLAKARLHQLDR